MKYLQNPVIRFVLAFGGLYVLWFLLYDLWLHPEGTLDETVILYSMMISQDILEMSGYVVFTDGSRVIGIEGTSGLWIGDSCNAIVLMALFSGFILAFPGKWTARIIYLLIGILSIFLLNILRIVILAIIDTHSRSWTEFNHSYTFTIVMYGFIFLGWYLWVRRYQGTTTVSE